MPGDYLTTGIPFEQMPLVDIRDPVLAGPGHGPIEAAVDTYRQLGERLQAAGDAVRAALLAAQAAHEGAAGEASARHLSALIAPGDVGAAQAKLAAMALEDQATYHVRARNELAALRPEDLSSRYAWGIKQTVPDVRKEQLHEEAVAAATTYQDNTNHNLLSAFQPFQPPQPATVDIAAAPPPAAGPAVGAGGPGGVPGGGAAGVSPAGGAGLAPVPPAPGAVPPGQPGAVVPPTGVVPPVVPPTTGPPRLPPPAVAGAPGAGPGGPGGPGGGGRPGAPVTVPQAVPQLPDGMVPPRPRLDDGVLRNVPPPPAGDGVITGGRQWPGAGGQEPMGRTLGAPGGGTAYPRGLPEPPRGAAEGSAPRAGAPAEPVRAPGAPRPAAPPGYGHMPFPGAAGGMARDEEHTRPSWLVEDDPEALWLGDLPPHVDPVIAPDHGV